MFENDSIHSFQRSTAKRSKVKGTTAAVKQSKDDFIMDTNNSSIVSKRSVEKLYWQGQPEFFRHFVSKFKRRSPLINRGYWLRVRAVETAVENFLKKPSEKHKLVVNLGCGYDPLPWLFFGKRPHLCANTTFVDVDYPPLMQKKLQMIQATPQLRDPLPELKINDRKDGVLCRSSNYAAVGCDLRNLDFLRFVLREQMSIDTCKVVIIFVAEVSIAYMDYDGSQAVLQWASSYDDVQFCLLEQHLPDGRDHPFAVTMLKHFDKLRTPLTAVGTMPEMKNRFVRAGWPEAGVNIRSLWDLWSDDLWITPIERKSLNDVEPFDEWEEFALFASHYFLLVATKPAAVVEDEQRQSHVLSIPNAQPASPNTSCKPLGTAACQRRFAAIVPSCSSDRSFAIHAGLGVKERQSDSISYAATADALLIAGPPLLNGLMCHTVTRLNPAGDCLLVGGRRSPSESSDRCWLRRDGIWTEVEPLPAGRFRHSSVAIGIDACLANVIVFGGKHSNGNIARDALIWHENKGWTILSAKTIVPAPRFGAVVLQDQDDDSTGLLFGGMSDDGVVLKDIWRWRLTSMTEVAYERLEDQALQQMNILHPELLWRFGAQATNWKSPDGFEHCMLVGGVGASMLTRDTEVVDLKMFTSMPMSGVRPLLIGMSLFENLCLGGGATCFSFGTCWSEDVQFEIERSSSPVEVWRALQKHGPEAVQALPLRQDAVSKTPALARLSAIPEISATDFRHSIVKRTPHVTRRCNIGDCVQKWSVEYLEDNIGQGREVSVHVATETKMDFASKNFSYAKMAFGEFIHKLNDGEKLYLRALSTESPSNEPTFLDKDFPAIAKDFHLPAGLDEVTTGMHSSPLRISGRVTMWLHYDVMANVLCQVRGRKRLILFPPTDVVNLSFDAGASSSSFDAFDQSSATQTILSRCHPLEVLLEPGDILYIPPLWLHTAQPTVDISIAVNVFFRDLQSGYSAGRDVYGNRDVAAYERGRKEISKIAQSFADLPSDMGQFYLKRLAAELTSLAHSR